MKKNASGTAKASGTTKAKIIGLWGDPGLTEFSHWDIASRFLIVQLSDKNGYANFGCVKDAASYIKLVLRPKSLWIRSETAGGNKRVDHAGNINVTSPLSSCTSVSYSDKNISSISPAYVIGEEITVSKFEKAITSFDGVDILKSTAGGSSCAMSDDYKNASIIYALTTIPGYFDKLPDIICYHGGNNIYTKAFNKITTTDKTIPDNPTGGIITLKGGIILDFNLPIVEYSDINSEGRSRAAITDCLPLIVANPSTFPTPASRNLGGINLTL